MTKLLCDKLCDMRLAEYIQRIDFPLCHMSEVFLIRGNRILLGKKIKKGGLGEGYYLGIGGKVESGESFEQAVIRETKEEIGVDVRSLEPRGAVYFYFPNKAPKEKWNFEVRLYTSEEWGGEPCESQEMVPEWFERSAIPFHTMWDDSRFWLPYILEGKSIEAHAMFDPASEKVQEFSIRFV